MKRTAIISASLFLASLLGSPVAHAWPIGRLLHLHPARTVVTDTRVSFQLYNRSGIIQEVLVSGRRYQLMPNSGLTITAPVGTQVLAETTGLGHNKGDVLLAVQPSLRDDTVLLR